jgi:hypothetical protein
MAQTNRPAEKEAIRTTIVGGRPPGCGQDVGAVPRGIEVLVKKASVDPAFRERLLRDRARAADSIGLTLAPAEALMLNAVPAAQLETVIGRTKVGELERRAFLGTAAAAMLAAIGSVHAGEDELPKVTGIAPDRPASKEVEDALAEHEKMRKDNEAACVVIATWYPTKDAMHAAINPQGQRALTKGGIPFPVAPLDKGSLNSLLAVLPKLSPSKAPATRDDALFVSFQDGGKWVTRQYSRAALPPDVAAITNLLGMPQDRPEQTYTRGIQPDRPLTKGSQPDRPEKK